MNQEMARVGSFAYPAIWKHRKKRETRPVQVLSQQFWGMEKDEVQEQRRGEQQALPFKAVIMFAGKIRVGEYSVL